MLVALKRSVTCAIVRKDSPSPSDEFPQGRNRDGEGVGGWSWLATARPRVDPVVAQHRTSRIESDSPARLAGAIGGSLRYPWIR